MSTELPPLPEPDGGFDEYGTPIYLAPQIQAYARAQAQQATAALQAELQQQALVHLSSEGQWIEHTGKLAAELAEVRRDAERLDWLEQNKPMIFTPTGHKDPKWWINYQDGSGDCASEITLRAAIDRARSTGAGEG